MSAPDSIKSLLTFILSLSVISLTGELNNAEPPPEINIRIMSLAVISFK